MNSRLCWTFAITSLALFAFALDRLVVAIALPAIRTDLGAQAAGLEWTVNAYTLSFAVLLLTGGALGDRFGRRRMFTIGVAVFTAGSAAAALAPTIGTLVAARAVQGVGGAIFTPLTLTMLSAVTPPGRRGTVLGAWGGIGGLGAALGPLAGGVLAGSVGWRAIFWLNVPLGLVLMPLARVRLAESLRPAAPAGPGRCRAGQRRIVRRGLGGDPGRSGGVDERRDARSRWAAGWRCWRCSCAGRCGRRPRCCRCASSAAGCSPPARWRAWRCTPRCSARCS